MTEYEHETEHKHEEPERKKVLAWLDRNIGKIIIGLDILGGVLCVGAIGYSKGVTKCDRGYQKVLKKCDDAGLIKAHHFDGSLVNTDSIRDINKWEREVNTIFPSKKM